MKKLSIFVIAMLLVVALAVPTFANPFTDVPANHWAYDAVNKLVAAGIVEGYPDGTYKGQNNMTRYEMAMIIARALDNLEAQREAMAEEIDAAKAGLSTAQAQDVTAIVKALIEKNKPEAVELPEGLTDKQAEEVANLIEALTFEYQAELKVLGQKIDVVTGNIKDMDAWKAEMEARIAALENPPAPVVTFSGSYSVDFTDQVVEGDVIDDEIDYMYDDPSDGSSRPDVIVYKDPFVYSDPWDDDSDTIDADKSDGEIEQTLNLQADIVKDGFAATVKFDAHEDDEIDDVIVLDSAELALENDKFAAVYNTANTADIADYAFSGAEFNGITVNMKDYGVDVFAGIKGYEGTTQDTTTEEFTVNVEGQEFTIEKDVDKYDDAGDPVYADDDYYVFGAKKAFDLAGLSLNAKYAGKANLNKVADEVVLDNWLGFDTAGDLAGLDVNFDFGYYLPDNDSTDESGTLVRFGVAQDFDVASVEFNYKNRDENFVPVSENGVVFDYDDDDYDKFTTGLGLDDMSGWNLTVAPKLFENIGLTTEFFYASVKENSADVDEDFGEETKLSLTGEMPVLMDGLKVNGEYTIVDPVEAADGEKERTMAVGAEYEKDYLTASAGYEVINDVDFVNGDDKKVTSFGVAVADYPVFGGLTASAGFDYEKEAEDFDLKTTEYNLGVGYAIGAANLSYDFTNKKVEGADDVNGTYKTNKVGLTYTIVEGTDLVASYEVLDLDLDEAGATLNGAGDYTVKTATAGVSIDF
ncbi:MAG: hypothetical protein PWR10_694 [Halanaerobiales bacterium]|nr:hypothetical protein [Halanaerobiales bacterium]